MKKETKQNILTCLIVIVGPGYQVQIHHVCIQSIPEYRSWSS